MSGPRRMPPFRGFSRGVPIIGEPKAQTMPAGRYYYHVPILVQSRRSVEATSIEVNFTAQMRGADYLSIVQRFGAEHYPGPSTRWARLLAWLGLRPGRANLVPLAPYFLGFVPDEPVAEEPKPESPKLRDVKEGQPEDVA